ncbi:MAG: hypothetical protein L3K26_17260 [Candidatus Hydrogenedentes bacterium]|nr:hypothetical protein [Candidatus Hydrogenedentota bacterium]
MLQFICPKCKQVLRIAPKYLGQRGSCNKCGTKIALIGSPNDPAPQAASLVEDMPAAKSDEPASEAQLEYLRRLGAKESQLLGLDKDTASDRIDVLKAEHRKQAPPTEKQLAHLARLGAPPARIEKVISQADASALIETMHLNPTRMQIELLQKLGTTGAQIARTKSKADASDLIEELEG